MNVLLNLSPSDHQRLTDAAIDRFSECYPTPEGAIVILSYDGSLFLAVKQAEHIDWLMSNATDLKHAAQMVFGAIEVSAWFLNQEIWSASTIESEVLSKESTLSENVMTTATLERTAPAQEVYTAPMPADSVTSIDSLASEMAQITGRPADEWRLQILNNSPVLFVSTTAAEAMLDRQIEQLQAMRSRLKPSIPASTNGSGSAPQTTAAKTKTTKRASKKQAAETPAE